jgi:cytochrome c-type biogenesis protein CcmE
MKPRHRRLIFVALGLALLGVTAALVLNAFRSNLVFFYSPTQVADKEAPVNKTFRLGGLVEQGSLKRLPDGVTVTFVVTDTGKSIPVRYKGILPDLFKEGKGVVAQGRLEPDGIFQAQEVLAKHDENYMPPEAADALQRANKARTETEHTLVQPAAMGVGR